MNLSLFAFLFTLVNSATLKQDTNANSLQPLQLMIQLYGDTMHLMVQDFNRMMIQLVYQGEADAVLTQTQACEDSFYGDILPQILSTDLERLAATCQDTNRTALLNTMLQDIAQGLANSTDPCLAVLARNQANIASYLSSAIAQGWQLDLGLTSSGQQFSVPVVTVVNNLQQLSGFLANSADQTDSAIVDLTDAIITLSSDASITELGDADDFASVADSLVNAAFSNGNQQLFQTIIQFLNEASILLCSIVGPVSSDVSGSSNS